MINSNPKKWLLMSFYLGCCHREECARAAMGTGFLYLSGLFVPRESTSRSRHVLFGSLREHQSFFIIWVSRIKKNSSFYVHFKMDWQFQLVSNKDKQVQINYSFRTYFSDSYLHNWRHDSSEIEAAEIMAKLRWMKSKQQPCLVLLSFFYFGNVS